NWIRSVTFPSKEKKNPVDEHIDAIYDFLAQPSTAGMDHRVFLFLIRKSDGADPIQLTCRQCFTRFQFDREERLPARFPESFIILVSEMEELEPRIIHPHEILPVLLLDVE